MHIQHFNIPAALLPTVGYYSLFFFFFFTIQWHLVSPEFLLRGWVNFPKRKRSKALKDIRLICVPEVNNRACITAALRRWTWFFPAFFKIPSLQDPRYATISYLLSKCPIKRLIDFEYLLLMLDKNQIGILPI